MPIRVLLFAASIAVCGAASSQSTPPVPTEAADPSTHAVRVTALELALANIVAEKPNLWRFDALEAEAAALLQESRTPHERETVREIADRIDRFAVIGQRYRDTRGAFPATESEKTEEAPRVTRNDRNAGESKSRGDTSKDYDAVGVLRPVVSKRADAPKFALIDDEGKVTTLVTPSPDLNLQPLVGKRIGVRGTRGFIPEYRRNYIAANRATRLDTRLR